MKKYSRYSSYKEKSLLRIVGLRQVGNLEENTSKLGIGKLQGICKLVDLRSPSSIVVEVKSTCCNVSFERYIEWKHRNPRVAWIIVACA